MNSAAAVQAYRCESCRRLQLAEGRCQQCRGAVTATAVSSSGEARAVTVIERVPPDVLREPPYGVVLVKLDGGPELVALFAATEAIGVGERVQVSLEEVSRERESTWTFEARPLVAGRGEKWPV
jgi:uncharacterized OB-fold protein